MPFLWNVISSRKRSLKKDMFFGVSSQEVALFYQRLGVLTNSGIPIHEALLFLEQGETNPVFRKALEEVYRSVTQGHLLSESLKRHQKIFSRLAVELIAVGENTGVLTATLHHIATLQQKSRERAHRISSALVYPACLACVMLMVAYLFVSFVSPGDKGLFAALGDDIPWPSAVLMEISTFARNPTLIIGMILSVVAVGLLGRRLLHEKPEIHLQLHSLYLSLPVLGSLMIKLEAARCLEVLASSIRVGASLPSSLRSSIRVVKNRKFKADLELVLQAVKNGQAFGSSFACYTSAPSYATALLEVSDHSGNLDVILKTLAEALDEEVNYELDAAVKLIEPAMLFVSGLAAGFVTLATFLPVIRLVAQF